MNQAFENYLGKYPTQTKVALDPEGTGAGISTRGDAPNTVFVTRQLAELLGFTSTMVVAPDPTVWYGTIGQLRASYESASTSITTTNKVPVVWLAVGAAAIAAMFIGYRVSRR